MIEVNKVILINRVKTLKEIQIVKARKSFYLFCCCINNNYINQNYLRIYCNTLQKLFEYKIFSDKGLLLQKLIINMPPRHFKTLTLVYFSAWLLGHNPNNIICYITNVQDLSNTFSRAVRNLIDTQKANNDIIYNDIFPETFLSKDNQAVEKWSVNNNFLSFKSASVESNITGMGFNITILDDLISNARDSYNSKKMNELYEWYINTFNSRKETRNDKVNLEIVNMTRWSEFDFVSKLEKRHNNFAKLVFPIKNQNGELLNNAIFSESDYEEKKAVTSEYIFQANFYQNVLKLKNKLYSLKTYPINFLPVKSEFVPVNKEPFFNKIIAFLDTANKGKDYLSMPIGGVKDGYIYIVDWLYTQEGTDYSVKEIVKLLTINKVQLLKVEGNAGGDLIADMVKNELRKSGNYTCKIEVFHQKENKEARILLNADIVNNIVLMPNYWERASGWTELYESFKYFNKTKNAHDDAQDSITGLVEMITKQNKRNLYG